MKNQVDAILLCLIVVCSIMLIKFEGNQLFVGHDSARIVKRSLRLIDHALMLGFRAK